MPPKTHPSTMARRFFEIELESFGDPSEIRVEMGSFPPPPLAMDEYAMVAVDLLDLEAVAVEMFGLVLFLETVDDVITLVELRPPKLDRASDILADELMSEQRGWSLPLQNSHAHIMPMLSRTSAALF